MKYHRIKEHLSSSMKVFSRPSWGSKLISKAQEFPDEVDGEGVGIVFFLVLAAMLIFFLLGCIEIILRVCFAFIKALFADRNIDRNLAKSRIEKAPGTNLLTIADFFFSSKTVEQTFKPIVSDWRVEYFEALKQGRIWKARWVSMRYRYSFIMAMSLSKVFEFLKQLRSVSK